MGELDALAFRPFLELGQVEDAHRLGVQPGDGFLRVYRGDGTFDNLSSVDTAQPLRANTYLVMGVDVQGDILTHYLNAQANGSGTVNINTADANTDLKIGSRTDLFTKLKGDIAELLIYDRGLSITERSNSAR